MCLGECFLFWVWKGVQIWPKSKNCFCIFELFSNIFVLRKETRRQKTKISTNIPLDFLIWMRVIHKLFMPLKHDLYTSSYIPGREVAHGKQTKDILPSLWELRSWKMIKNPTKKTGTQFYYTMFETDTASLQLLLSSPKPP